MKNNKIMTLALCCAAAFNPFDMLEAGWVQNITGVFSQAEEVEQPSIKVLLMHDQDAVIVEVKGTYNLYDPRNGELISPRFKGKRRNLRATREGISWGEEFPGIHQIAIIPDDYKTRTIVDGIEYIGGVFIYDVGGTISVVNKLPVEEYLDSIMTPMFRNEMPQELLAALAITARTNAYFQSKNSKTPYWDVDANQVGYKGTLTTTSGSPVQKALQQTRYMILNQSGVNDWVSTPFAVQWGAYNIGKGAQDQPVYSKISILEAESMAKKAITADVILAKAFPETTIELYKPATETAQK